MSALPEETVLDTALRVLALDDGTPDDGNLAASPWQVSDERSAESALLRIRQARLRAHRRSAAAREMLAAHEAESANLRERISSIEADAAHTTDHFEALLKDWHRQVLDEDPRSKSIKLGSGLLRSRMTPGKVLSVADPEALPAALQRVKVEADRAAITAHIKAEGEVPEGVEWEHPHRTYTVVI